MDELTPVTSLIIGAFRAAQSRLPTLHRTWVDISHRVGSLVPNSGLFGSIQRAGDLDLVIRCMEDDYFLPRSVWLGFPTGHISYDAVRNLGRKHLRIVRLLQERKVMVDDTIRELGRDLRLVRIPLEKHQIAADNMLNSPLYLTAGSSPQNVYEYKKGDRNRAHIMPAGFSGRGSAIWHPIRTSDRAHRAIERRGLSERLVAYWAPARPEIEIS